LILSDVEIPAAGQILHLTFPWSDEISLVAPLPAVATLRVPNVLNYWIGAAMEDSLLMVVEDPTVDDRPNTGFA
jgi:hypothetical protein